MINKPGPAQVGAISKAQKWQKDIKVSKYSFYSTKNCFLKKVSQRRKKWKGGPFGIFLYPVCRKTENKIEGGTLWGNFFFRRKSLAMPKKTKRGEPLVSSGIVCYAGNFLVLFPGPTGEIWNFVKTFGRTILDRSGVWKKNRRKAMTIVDSLC